MCNSLVWCKQNFKFNFFTLLQLFVLSFLVWNHLVAESNCFQKLVFATVYNERPDDDAEGENERGDGEQPEVGGASRRMDGEQLEGVSEWRGGVFRRRFSDPARNREEDEGERGRETE